MEKKNFTAASVLVAMLIASGHFVPANAGEDAGTSLQTTEDRAFDAADGHDMPSPVGAI